MKTPSIIVELSLIIICGAIAICGVFRIGRGRSLRQLLPFLFESAVPVALIAVAILPSALPSVFEMFLGHSPYSLYSFKQANGILVSETWMLSRWCEPCATVLYVSVTAGVLLALWNLFSQGYRFETAIALLLACVWLAIGLTSLLTLVPFFAMDLTVPYLLSW